SLSPYGAEFNTGNVPGAVVGTLNTAPELRGVPNFDDPGHQTNPSWEPTNNFVVANKLTGSTTHLLPRFFELPGDSPQLPVRYMVAVPAGQVAVNGSEAFMQPWTVPAPYGQYKHHLKVCIYDL